MLMNQRRGRGFYGGRESGAVGPLEASRGAEVDWATGYRFAIQLLYLGDNNDKAKPA